MPATFEPNQQGLTTATDRALLLDIEANPGASCQDICELQPALRKGIYLRAARGRHCHLLQLKGSNPGVHWKLCALANSPDFAMMTKGNDEGAPAPAPTPIKANQNAKPSPVHSSTRSKSPVVKKPPAQNAPAGKGHFDTPRSASKKDRMFASLHEAIDYADDTILVDFKCPEKNNQGLFI